MKIAGKSLSGKIRSVLLARKRARYLRLLTGAGLEIGALQRPCVASDLDVSYVDRLTRDEALREFPELSSESIVEVDIVDDAESLATVPGESQDFVIASHVIEHLKNPVAALRSWARVLRVGGRLFIAVPDKHQTFDRERAITPLQHVIDDYQDPSPERDYLAFEDFALYVSCRYFNHRPEAEYREYAKELYDTDYSIHYHVWDYPAFQEVLDYVSDNLAESTLQVVKSMRTYGEEFIFVVEKR